MTIRSSYWGALLAGWVWLGVSGSACAACRPGVEDLGYTQAVVQGDPQQALAIVLKGLPLTSEERLHFRIVRGLSARIGESHGQSDPDTGAIQIDPGLFEEGESGACQGVMHEVTHLRRFRQDRARLKAFYASHSESRTGWAGCDSRNSTPNLTLSAMNRAYDCLEDNDLITHAASAELEAVLAQRPFADNGALRGEDIAYLINHLHRWATNPTMVQGSFNRSYYLPEIKKEDTRIFCRGILFVRELGGMDPTLTHAAGEFCTSEKLKQK